MNFMYLTKAEIDLDSLAHNFAVIKEHVGVKRKILAAVKADAYGHGAVVIARKLVDLGVNMLGVATIKEAIELRKAGLKCPILILSGSLEQQVEEIIDYDITQTIYTLSLARALSDCALRRNKQVKIHIKVDTGMGRIGILLERVLKIVEEIQRLPNLVIEGIFTHLAVADVDDEENISYTTRQIANFQKLLNLMKENNVHIPIKHAANSACIINYPESYFDMVRPGIMLYGAYPSALSCQKVILKPVMSLKTRIINLKTIPPGSSISYGRTFISGRESQIATIAIGYADGYDRSLSNKADVIFQGERAPLVGTICMDMCMADVTDIKSVHIGDEVILFGKYGNEEIPVDELAKKINTISYEILSNINRRVPRVYIKNNKIINIVDYLLH